MTRKVLTIGKSSYAVTLPQEYIREHGLNPGDDIFVSQEGNTLSIRPEQAHQDHAADFSQARGCSPTFGKRILHGYYLLGAENLTLTNIPAPIHAQLRAQLQRPGSKFYEQDAKQHQLHITCPEHFGNKQTLTTLIKGFIQSLYKRLSNKEAREQPCSCRMDVARRAISQNLSQRKDLALYSFIENINLACELTADIKHDPDYLADYAQITYHLQQYYLAGSLPQIEHACEQLTKRDEQNRLLGKDCDPYAKLLHRHLTRAATDLFIYKA